MIISENKKKILNGIEKVRDIIIHTYGPQGRTWLLGDENNYQINDDGYKIIKSLSFEDKYENIGLKLILDMVSKTENEAHDATTLVTLLATSFIHEIYKSDVCDNPQKFISYWDKNIKKIIDYLHLECEKNISKEILINIASICAKNEELGKLVGSTIYDLGVQSNVCINISEKDETYIEYQKGYSLEDFFLGKQYILSNYKNISDIRVLIVGDTLDSLVPFLSLFKQVKEKNEKLLLICFNYYDDILNTIINLVKEKIVIIPYKLRGSKNMQTRVVEDLEMICNAKIYKKNDLFNCKVTELPLLENIEITDHSINIYYQNLSNLKEGIEEERKSKLLCKSANIYVGGTTTNMKNEIISRMEDAKFSCYNTLKYGYVLGGGKALFNASFILVKENEIDRIISSSLRKPFLTLLENSGYSNKDKLSKEEGIDLFSHEIVSYKDNNIFDCIYGIERALINASGLVYTIIHLYDAKIN